MNRRVIGLIWKTSESCMDASYNVDRIRSGLLACDDLLSHITIASPESVVCTEMWSSHSIQLVCERLSDSVIRGASRFSSVFHSGASKFHTVWWDDLTCSLATRLRTDPSGSYCLALLVMFDSCVLILLYSCRALSEHSSHPTLALSEQQVHE